MSEQVTFAKRFRGPATSANGGYACGVIANLVGGDVVESTLRAPPPLDTPIDVHREDGLVQLKIGDKLIAEGKRAALDLEVPKPPTLAEATTASRPGGADRHAYYSHHILPECFVCGITRTPGDALCLWPAKVEGRDLIATPWVPGTDVCDGDTVRSEVVWSALDCPTGWVFVFTHQIATPALLGRMCAEIVKPLKRGETYLSVGWPIGHEQRKAFGGSAIFAADGTLHARAKGTWIRLGA